MEKLGFIGTGGMGSLMATNLINAGFGLTVFDATREATRTLEGVSHEVFKDSLSYSESMRRVCERLEDKAFKPRKSWTPKDVGFGLQSAQESGVPMPLTTLVQQLFNVARSNALDGYEATGIAYKVYERLGNGEPKK